MTTPPLPELFERVAAKVPEIRRIDRANLQWICGGWWHGDEVGVPEPVAEALIEAACVRWLTKNGAIAIRGNRVSMGSRCSDINTWYYFEQDTLAHALLLAVEAVAGGGKEGQ